MQKMQKVKPSKQEHKEKHKTDNEKLKKYKISQIAKKQNISFEEAELIYNTRIQEQENLAKRKKKKVKKNTKSWNDTNSVYTSLSGVTGARTWNKVK